MSVNNLNTNQSTVSNFPQRPPIDINGFCRVTKHRSCRVCGKPDWCGYTTDEQTSICMRNSIGSKGTSRNGGNIFHHNRLFLVANPRTNRNQAPPPIEIAPIEVRNAVYQELMRRLPALKYYSQLMDVRQVWEEMGYTPASQLETSSKLTTASPGTTQPGSALDFLRGFYRLLLGIRWLEPVSSRTLDLRKVVSLTYCPL